VAPMCGGVEQCRLQRCKVPHRFTASRRLHEMR
jgi:hypothetical protein